MSELHPLLHLSLLYVLHEEPERVVPREEDVLDNVPHSFLLETKALPSHNWRVDEVQSRKGCEGGVGREGWRGRKEGGRRKERDTTLEHNVKLVSRFIALVTTQVSLI